MNHRERFLNKRQNVKEWISEKRKMPPTFTKPVNESNLNNFFEFVSPQTIKSDL